MRLQRNKESGGWESGREVGAWIFCVLCCSVIWSQAELDEGLCFRALVKIYLQSEDDGSYLVDPR